MVGGVGREEDDRERRDRQMLELLNELRVAIPGVQILFAFLLTVPFTQRFGDTSTFQRDVFYITLLATAASTICFLAPTAMHRLRLHKGDRAFLIETSNKLSIAGMVFLGIALGGAVLLITDVLFDGTRVWLYPALVVALLAVLWFALPLSRTIRGVSSGP
jgi:cobalamin synthase